MVLTQWIMILHCANKNPNVHNGLEKLREIKKKQLFQRKYIKCEEPQSEFWECEFVFVFFSL